MPYDYPKRFGKYFLTRRIAVGGMAEVFRAKLVGIKGFEKTLALKRILPEFSEDEEFVQMFVDEARISSNLHHNNIVQVFDFGRVENAYYIAMEYIDGVNLRNLVQRQMKTHGTFPRNTAYYILLQIARSLDYAHNVKINGHEVLNLVHRDVSPQNVLVSRNGEVKITDFGIAKAEIRLSKTQPGKIQGKFSYMSPEQAAGKSIDRRSDIFSLGVIAYELLSGMKVYSAEETRQKYQEVREAHITRLAELTKDLPSEVESLVMQMVSRDVADRPQSCAEIATRLAEFLSDIPMNRLTVELGQMIDELYPKEKSDPSVNRRIQEMVERGSVPLDMNTEIVLADGEKIPPVGPVTKVATPDKDETTVANWPLSLFTSPLGRLALFSVFLSILAVLWYWVQTSKQPDSITATPLQKAPTAVQATPRSGPADSDVEQAANQREKELVELQKKNAALEEETSKLETELKQADTKLKQIEKSDRDLVGGKARPCPSDMAMIATGTFIFGSSRDDPARQDLVEPPATHSSNAKFCVDKFEYPNQKGAMPKSRVTWAEAQATCNKESKRLCTQEEWERACKGPGEASSHHRYPYGEKWDPNRCNTEKLDRATGENIDRSIAPAGAFPSCVSPDGVYDLSGNVDEWTGSQGRFSPEARVSRGGSSSKPDWATRCSSIREVIASSKESDLGFRCCKDAL